MTILLLESLHGSQETSRFYLWIHGQLYRKFSNFLSLAN